MSNTINFNKEQLAAVKIDKNAVVSAGAGSGKTTVLAGRFLDLIQSKGYKVDEILTLTFTKKATTEMSDRIYKKLQEFAPDQASNFFRANIKTLDSYCASVAKAGALYFGVSPDFTQDDDEVYNQIFQKALPFILEHRDNIAIKTFMDTRDYTTIARQLFVDPILKNSTIAKEIDFRAQLKKQQAFMLDLYTETADNISKNLEGIVSSFNDFDGNRSSVFMKTLAEYIEGEKLPVAPSLTMEDIINGNAEKLAEFTLELSSLCRIKQNGCNAAHQGMTVPLRTMRKPICDTVLPSIVNFIHGQKLTLELLPLMEEFQQMVNHFKRTSGILTFSDISSMAVETLIMHPEIRQAEKTKFKAIMIDEFQDNNTMQKDMLFLLAEKMERNEKSVPEVDELIPNKLFFVGDEKQSIYRFRGADVAVFRNLWNMFPAGQLNMSNNFRSNQGLIACFNTFFGGEPYPTEKNPDALERPSIFHTEKNREKAAEFEAVYTNATLSETAQAELEDPETFEKCYAPKIHFGLYDENQVPASMEYGNENAEIVWIARKIKSLIDNGQDPSEIAILLRSYTLQPVFERTFLRYGIPYNTELITGFFSDGPVNDIISYLRLCTYPNETISYAQVLRSPFVNLSNDETNQILKLKKETFSEEIDIILEEEGALRYKKAREYYKAFCNEIKDSTIAALITKLWYEAGYRYETIWNHTVEMYGKMYDLLFELARKADEDNSSLADFVDGTEIYKKDSEKLQDMDIPMETSKGVHILSIHKSKGLEYDVVFIPNTHKRSNRSTNTSAVYYSKDFGLSINTPPYSGIKNKNYFYASARDDETKKAAAELRRLVYVAITRAKKEIYITNGKYKRHDDAYAKWGIGGSGVAEQIFQILEPTVNFYYQPDSNEENPAPFDIEMIPPQPKQDTEVAGGRKNTISEKIAFAMELSDKFDNPDLEIVTCNESENIHVSPSKLHKEDEESGKKQQMEAEPGTPYKEINDIVISTIPKKSNGEEQEPRFKFSDFGTIAHAFMEAKMKGEIPEISAKNIAGLENNQSKLNSILKICSEMSESFMQTDLGKQAEAATWRKTEYEFKSAVAGKIINGIIDLVFQEADGSYSIVDYKTNQKIEPEIYYQQLTCYRQAIAQIRNIDSAAKIRCYLYYLRFGTVVEITEECNKVNLEEAVKSITD